MKSAQQQYKKVFYQDIHFARIFSLVATLDWTGGLSFAPLLNSWREEV